MIDVKNGIWRWVAGILAAALFSGSVVVLSLRGDKISRAELRLLMEQSSPWLRDRGKIEAEIRINTIAVKELKEAIASLIREQQKILIAQEILVEKLAQLIKDRQ